MRRGFILLFLLFSACGTENGSKPTGSDLFAFPVIIQKENHDTAKPFYADCVTGIYPRLYGRFTFGDTLDFSKPFLQEMSEDQYTWENKMPDEKDTLSSDGLQVIPDYQTGITFTDRNAVTGLYYSVYIVNETHESKIFFGKNEHALAIQEAIDSSDNSWWHPIEFPGYDFCGNGRFRKKIKPHEYLVILLPKYSGMQKTLLRVRFQIGENVFITKPFAGIINPKQFDINKKDLVYHWLESSKGSAASWIFFGGRPKGFESNQ